MLYLMRIVAVWQVRMQFTSDSLSATLLLAKVGCCCCWLLLLLTAAAADAAAFTCEWL
jgi:hypothetical protein